MRNFDFMTDEEQVEALRTLLQGMNRAQLRQASAIVSQATSVDYPDDWKLVDPRNGDTHLIRLSQEQAISASQKVKSVAAVPVPAVWEWFWRGKEGRFTWGIPGTENFLAAEKL